MDHAQKKLCLPLRDPLKLCGPLRDLQPLRDQGPNVLSQRSVKSPLALNRLILNLILHKLVKASCFSTSIQDFHLLIAVKDDGSLREGLNLGKPFSRGSPKRFQPQLVDKDLVTRPSAIERTCCFVPRGVPFGMNKLRLSTGFGLGQTMT